MNRKIISKSQQKIIEYLFRNGASYPTKLGKKLKKSSSEICAVLKVLEEKYSGLTHAYDGCMPENEVKTTKNVTYYKIKDEELAKKLLADFNAFENKKLAQKLLDESIFLN